MIIVACTYVVFLHFVARGWRTAVPRWQRMLRCWELPGEFGPGKPDIVSQYLLFAQYLAVGMLGTV